jgi:hypothetical protein
MHQKLLYSICILSSSGNEEEVSSYKASVCDTGSTV